MSKTVAVIGEGVLSQLVSTQLENDFRVYRQDNQAGVPMGADLVLFLHDNEEAAVPVQPLDAVHLAGIPWLRGVLFDTEAVIGPLVRPGTAGCFRCADIRRLMAGRDRQELSDHQLRQLAEGGTADEAKASPAGQRQVSLLLAAEVRRFLELGCGFCEGRVYLVSMRTLKTSLHAYLPDSMCEVCGQMEDDSPDRALISVNPGPTISGDGYRCHSIDDFSDVLPRDYLDDRTGIFQGRMAYIQSTFADVHVNLPTLIGTEITSGRSHSYATSELTAIMEGLERWCGLSPRGKRTVIHDSYRNVSAQALDPLSVGVYSKEQYELPDFPFQPFDPGRPIDWVWGYSFLQEAPVLVPEQLAYYSMGGGDSFVHETSNGCALGGSLAEAILHGIFEVVERDSFLMTWYAKLPVPRLDPLSANNTEVRLMVDRMEAVTGYDVYLFNTTMENGIPSIWALAKNNRQDGGMNLLCAAGAHLDPARAVKSALHEIAGMLPWLNDSFKERRVEVEAMYDDSSLVVGMGDHCMLYGLPQAEQRLDFLLTTDRPLRTFNEEFDNNVKHEDLTDYLKEIVQVFRQLNHDVIVVNQSSPETLTNGLHVVKVIIPGMIPITFGHHLTRLTRLDRLLRVPKAMGYAQEQLTLAQLNAFPHPFP
ncbi:TOMM precursor leader peptide-binding protein [Paenibacillus xerothermodurans]|uniref:Bacteriocin biosynthesis protein SagD n=1 Tax=Paenibacillus xerothermodurans TaxID=1977292 RepID=A0A2W1NAX0_PAEXE|nr:TOMM precursor leader peptide-binding protein [Paenibacillus xerothermodurans]PZE21567.1 bacteriocin biosynthesis protein SagD [Paenibacillus xerothermodurans]